MMQLQGRHQGATKALCGSQATSMWRGGFDKAAAAAAAAAADCGAICNVCRTSRCCRRQGSYLIDSDAMAAMLHGQGAAPGCAEGMSAGEERTVSHPAWCAKGMSAGEEGTVSYPVHAAWEHEQGRGMGAAGQGTRPARQV